MSDIMESPFKPGDRVEVNGHEGWTGNVVLVDLSRRIVWLDMHPGAVGGYHWIIGRLPDSWTKSDELEMHALNPFDFSSVRQIPQGEEEKGE